MAGSKHNKIHRVPVKSLTGEYLSSNTRQGGTYLSTYHRSIPKILIGSVKFGTSDIFIPCNLLRSGYDMPVSGFIENEYLLSDIKMYYKIVGGELPFTPIERELYGRWSFSINPFDIYSSNYTQIELKLEGVDPQGVSHTYTELYNIVIEDDCELDKGCKDSITEALAEFKGFTENVEVFKIKIGGVTHYAESLTALKDIFQQQNITVDVYAKQFINT